MLIPPPPACFLVSHLWKQLNFKPAEGELSGPGSSLSLCHHLCPAELKQITWISATGLLMVVFGECLRKAAMFTAGSNFNHVVQNEKSETHTLVTSGVYAWFRHPSYVGWFYWSIGTQVWCQNQCQSPLKFLKIIS